MNGHPAFSKAIQNHAELTRTKKSQDKNKKKKPAD
jgi:hypothetical protein